MVLWFIGFLRSLRPRDSRNESSIPLCGVFFSLRCQLKVTKLLPREVDCHLNGLYHTRGVGHPRSSDVKCSSVVNGGPDDGQTQSDVHSSVEAKKLQGDVALIVVHGYDDVERVLRGFEEDGVGRKGTLNVYPPCDSFMNCWCDVVPLLPAEEAVLPRMWV